MGGRPRGHNPGPPYTPPPGPICTAPPPLPHLAPFLLTEARARPGWATPQLITSVRCVGTPSWHLRLRFPTGDRENAADRSWQSRCWVNLSKSLKVSLLRFSSRTRFSSSRGRGLGLLPAAPRHPPGEEAETPRCGAAGPSAPPARPLRRASSGARTLPRAAGLRALQQTFRVCRPPARPPAPTPARAPAPARVRTASPAPRAREGASRPVRVSPASAAADCQRQPWGSVRAASGSPDPLPHPPARARPPRPAAPGSQKTAGLGAACAPPRRCLSTEPRPRRSRLTRPFRARTRTQTPRQPLHVCAERVASPLPVPLPGAKPAGAAYLARSLTLRSRRRGPSHTFCNIVDGERKCYKSSLGHVAVPQPPPFPPFSAARTILGPSGRPRVRGHQAGAAGRGGAWSGAGPRAGSGGALALRPPSRGKPRPATSAPVPAPDWSADRRW